MNNEVVIAEKNITETVLNAVTKYTSEGRMALPKTYSVENAMKSAYLMLQNVQDKEKKPALTVCKPDSIANTLLDMAIQGLSPAKKQCYFIVYGDQLQLQRSYFGTIMVTKALSCVSGIDSQVIYEGDNIEIGIDNGVKSIINHEQNFMNIDPEKIKGAYCIIKLSDGTHYTEIMNINQIYTSWQQSKAFPFESTWVNGKSGKKGHYEVNKPLKLNPTSVHAKFTDQMALKTVINRACKMFANTSDDSDLLIESFNRTTENEFDNDKESTVIADIEASSTEVEPAAEQKVIEADTIEETPKTAEGVSESNQVELEMEF